MKPPARLVLNLSLVLALLASLVLETAGSTQAAPPALPQPLASGAGKDLWRAFGRTRLPAPARAGARPAVQPNRFSAYALNRAGLAGLLASAAGARGKPFELTLPTPAGGFQRFLIAESDVMAPGLAARHPEIKTYAGRGVDDPAATIHADLSQLGFHASVRSPGGAWYIDPYYHLDQSVYLSYYGRDLKDDSDVPFVERDADAAELSVDRGYYHAANTVTVYGSAFASDAQITITISDPEEHFATRTLSARSNALGSFEASFVADPNGKLDTHIVEASDGSASALASYQVVRDDDPTSDPPTGDVLRTYRLALITDPGYATFFGGSANVTAAKVALMNRVDQVYHDDLSIHLQLIDDNDLLNLDTYAQAIAPNGPCGAAGCFTQPQVTGCSSTARARFVIGQIVGASNYDIGHLALGQPGGGVANLGVVGRSNKAGGCTGIPTPTGDFYAVDYVAHEMGHQFSGNHPFNGNQLNCSGGNRSGATSVEPGSGSSIMAYAGICLTDDLQAHSDPYFSQRSLQEISTYTSSNQVPINEVQTASLRHFGGGNEVQVVTFGPGYSRAATVQPASLTINAAPSATSRGGAEEIGTTVTIATSAAHTLQVGDVVTIASVGVAGYNGTFTISAVPTTRSFQYTNPNTGLATSGGGTVTLAAPGATQSGSTVTIRTAAAHGRSVGDVVTITGVGVAGYNGTFTISAVPTARSFQYTNPNTGLANSGGGSSTYFSPFQVRVGGDDSATLGGDGLPYTAANIQSAINAIPGFAGTVTVTGAASTGFTVTYGGASAGADVPNIELVNLSCGGCFASVEETNHGGTFDSFRLNYNGALSAPITNGTNYTAVGIQAALAPILPAGTTVTVAGFGGGAFNNTGFQVTFGGALAATNVPVLLGLQDFSAGASGFVGETDKGGAVDNKGGIITNTGNTWPAVTVPSQYTIPLRTPFALTGSATDAEGDPLLYSWEQNDRGGSAGTSLLNNTKTDGPLFAMFPKSGQISDADALLYDSPGENHLTGDPTRVFPDMQQILDNNTNADTGACPTGPIAPQAAFPVRECFAEFLPTSSYIGFTGINASPLSLHFRLTVRDGKGGVNAGDTTLLLATGAGPFLVTSQGAPATYKGGSTQTITWNVANTNVAPVSAANVKISLSADGGATFPYVLAESTPNDGSEALALPNVATTKARVKIEAVDNIFFDISNANAAIEALPVLTNSLGGGSQSVQYSDALAPDLTIAASDADTTGASLSASASGLPAGLSLALVSTSSGSALPGARTWKVAGATTAAAGSYPVSVTVADGTGGASTTTFTIVVVKEDATLTYTGDSLVSPAKAGGSVTVKLSALVSEAADGALGNTLGGKQVKFTIIKSGGATAGTVTATINATTRVAAGTIALSADSYTVQLELVANSQYAALIEDAVLTVADPGSGVVSGGGWVTEANGTRGNLGFSVKYTPSGNPQGNNLYISRLSADLSAYGAPAGVRSYNLIFKSNAMLAMTSKATATPKTASFSGRNTVKAVDRLTGQAYDIAGGVVYSFQVDLTDRGDPGSADSYAIRIWSAGGVFKTVGTYSASGANTAQVNLGGGNLQIK